MRNQPMPAYRARPPTMPPTLGELMKSPPKDYMSVRQLAFFENLLIKTKAEFLESTQAIRVGLRDDEAHADPTDCACVEEEHAMATLLCSREFHRMREIDSAINRIHNRSYGWCRDSGEPIGLGRLLACPTAVFCIQAQALHEHASNPNRTKQN
ncbi:TraR/DksA family transcriptional regulator [Bordetella sp. FB-8]|uniref:TraR/DksA family transcriptional regulator n=1 Tax=Bordetella sp. FB-8 TaxID=1159870 RepID=UPI0003A1C694|nr:TraR/DksA family transcriptional regulator [Bordetella sp. FB-8]